jgi:hypothetical protein
VVFAAHHERAGAVLDQVVVDAQVTVFCVDEKIKYLGISGAPSAALRRW